MALGVVAPGAAQGARPACRGDRDARRGDDAVRRQDRYAYREPNAGGRAVARRRASHEVRDGAPSPEAARLVDVAALASAVHATDPMDRAIREPCRARLRRRAETATRSRPIRCAPGCSPSSRCGHATKAARSSLPRARRRPFSISAGWRSAIAHRSSDAVAGDGRARACRVLGVARRDHDGDPASDPAGEAFTFEGLVGFLDPVRAGRAQALAEARDAGIAVAMITGDYPATALAIARQAGIDTDGGVLTGRRHRAHGAGGTARAPCRRRAGVRPRAAGPEAGARRRRSRRTARSSP